MTLIYLIVVAALRRAARPPTRGARAASSGARRRRRRSTTSSRRSIPTQGTVRVRPAASRRGPGGVDVIAATPELQYDSLERQHATARLGMWIFLGSELAAVRRACSRCTRAYRFAYPVEFHAAVGAREPR